MIARVTEGIRSAKALVSEWPKVWFKLQMSKVDVLLLQGQLMGAEEHVRRLLDGAGDCMDAPLGPSYCAAHNKTNPCPVQLARDWLKRPGAVGS